MNIDVKRPRQEMVAVAPTEQRLTDILAAMAARAEGPVRVAAIRDALGDRSFAALLVLFAAFNLLPLPPGSTLIFGIPLMLISGQMALGYDTVWLPQRLLNKEIAPDTFRNCVARMNPWLCRLQDVVKPRHWPFCTQAVDRWIGLLAFILSVVVFLPIPLGNWLPAFSIATLGISLSERDGLLLAAGVGIAMLAAAVIFLVVGSAGVLASAVFGIHW